MLCRYFHSIDIHFKSFSTPRQLKRWLEQNPALTVVCLVIEAGRYFDSTISDIHSRSNVRSILVRCEACNKDHLQVSTRSYFKVNGIFTDDTRLLIKLGFDLSFYSEELGDHFKEDKNDALQARRHYDRALSLCSFLEQIEQLDETETRSPSIDHWSTMR